MKGSNTIQIFQDNISEYLAIVVSMTNFGFIKNFLQQLRRFH